MYNDPTVERIRKVRKEIADRFNNDTKKIGEYYLQLQKDLEAKRKNFVIKEQQRKYKPNP